MEDRPKSEFNAALEYLERLIILKQNAAQASMTYDGFGWLQALAGIVRWVSHHMSKPEREEAEKLIIEIQREIHQNGSKTRGIPNGLKSDTYMKLHKFELWLNEIIKDAGLYARMKDDASNALK